MTAAAAVLYADLVCPFCHGLEERMAAAELDRWVEWRGVQHAPELPVPMRSLGDRQRQALRDEVATVRRLAPELAWRAPGALPNSRLAIQTVAAIGSGDPAAQRRARLALGRALWFRGDDISDPSVVQRVLTEAGVGVPKDSDAGRSQALAWQEAWNALAAQVVPTLVRSDGAVLQGLVALGALRRFLRPATTEHQ